ncbi:MAG: DUF937 domain-containing protein [Firmicutes bacterium]|nr:DUF937 domain-containing protein [Bacillota bacterium]
MSSLLESMLGSMTQQSALSALSGKTGASSDQVSSLLGSALPTLMESLTNNASTEEGALSLQNALSQHTSTAPVADQIAQADEVDGGKIIGHILGANQGNVVNSLSSESGLTGNQVSSILSNIAPALLSGVSAAGLSSAVQSASTGKPEKSSGKSYAKLDLSDGFDLKDVMGLTSQLLGKKKTSSQNNGTDLLSLLAKLTK